jgi:uncharacterized protein (TIGR02145 family)
MKKTIYLFTMLAFISFTGRTQTTVTDIDGNVYNTVDIGTQQWLTENLKTTRLKDGTSIPLVADNTAWINLTTPGYCWYNNDQAANGATYGALYNWYAVSTEKLCPTGWHVPSDTEWVVLVDYLGGASVAGNKMKEAGTTHWFIPNTGATNESGFTALPGGQRGAYGVFDLLRATATWWTATAIGIYNPGTRYITYSSGLVGYVNENKEAGKSVRCIKGDVSGINTPQNSPVKINVYPNPSHGIAMIEYTKAQRSLLQVIDVLGEVVIEKQITGKTEIELPNKGIYIVKISDGSGIITEKLIVQ